MSIGYVGDVTSAITATKTHVHIPDSDEKTIVLWCGDRSIEVSWRELFLMLEHAAHEWSRRGE